MTKAEVEHIHAESSADYVNPADNTADCFEKYYAEKFKGAAKHVNKEGAADDDWLPDNASTQDILSSVPVYDAQATMHIALTMWVSMVHEHAKVSATYNFEHTQAHAEVGGICF